MSFYNPYMKGPDVGQGMQDMLPMMLLMMYLKDKKTKTLGETPVPPARPMGDMAPGGMNEAPATLAGPQFQRPPTPSAPPMAPQGGGMGAPSPQGGGGGLDPKMLMAILPLLLPLLLGKLGK